MRWLRAGVEGIPTLVEVKASCYLEPGVESIILERSYDIPGGGEWVVRVLKYGLIVTSDVWGHILHFAKQHEIYRGGIPDYGWMLHWEILPPGFTGTEREVGELVTWTIRYLDRAENGRVTATAKFDFRDDNLARKFVISIAVSELDPDVGMDFSGLDLAEWEKEENG